jgi:hypothetical protein
MIFIKELGIYGEELRRYKVKNNKNELEDNIIIRDFVGIEHEYFESEIEYVDDIDTSIKKSKCNLPLEKLIELFNNIDKKYKLIIESNKDYVSVMYGNTVWEKELQKPMTNCCFIKKGELFLPDDICYRCDDNEYKCKVFYTNDNVKEAVFELYMNIITRLKYE